MVRRAPLKRFSPLDQDEDGKAAFQRELDAKNRVKQTPWQQGGDTAASAPRRRNLEDKAETATVGHPNEVPPVSQTNEPEHTVDQAAIKTVSTPKALKDRSRVAIRINVSRQHFDTVETWALANDQNPQNVMRYFFNSAKTTISGKRISLTSAKHRAKLTEILNRTRQDTVFLQKFDVFLTAAEITKIHILCGDNLLTEPKMKMVSAYFTMVLEAQEFPDQS